MLADCFTASPKMLRLYVPFFLEKINVKSLETKLESFDILIKIVQTFTSTQLDHILSQILSLASNVYFKNVSDQQI